MLFASFSFSLILQAYKLYFYFIIFIILSGLESDSGFGQCKSLVSLNIEKNRVTAKGARLAMEHLPNLQIFKCPFTLHVAAQMFKEGGFTSKADSSQRPPGTRIRQLRLMDLRYDGHESVPYKKGDLEAAIKLCPSVVQVEIAWDDTFSDEELKPLLKLKNLQHLCLVGTNSLSFEGGLLPILEKLVPSTLEKLELSFFPDVDVSAIAQHCSNLRFLALGHNYQYLTPTRPLKPADNRLQRLERLEIDEQDYESAPPPTAADLLILLSSPALVTIVFYRLNHDSCDQVMEEAAHLYGFPNLRELRIEYCRDTFTERSIECLLTLDNPLEKICFFGGWMDNAPKEQFLLEKWEREAKKNNWDLAITIKECL